MREVNGQTPRAIIRQTILGMERPFCLSELFEKLDNDYQIVERQLILNILEEMCESGAIKYSEVVDDSWRYSVVSA